MYKDIYMRGESREPSSRVIDYEDTDTRVFNEVDTATRSNRTSCRTRSVMRCAYRRRRYRSRQFH